MKLKNSKAEAVISCLVFFAIALAACQGIQTRVAPQDLNSLIRGGPHAGSWESNDVFLEYQYIYQPGTLKLTMGGNAKRGYDQLSVWILFFDTQGKLLATKTAYDSGFRQRLSRAKDRIEKTFEIPMSSTQFAFQSMLRAREGR